MNYKFKIGDIVIFYDFNNKKQIGKIIGTFGKEPIYKIESFDKEKLWGLGLNELFPYIPILKKFLKDKKK